MSFNYKNPVFVAVTSAVIITVIQQGGNLISKIQDANAWDTEVKQEIDNVKRVVEPGVRSLQSLAIDRKENLLVEKEALIIDIERTPVDDRTLTQRQLHSEVMSKTREIRKDLIILNEDFKSPVFEEIERPEE